MIGNLGDVVFEVTDKKLLTFSDLSFEISPRIATHEPLMDKPKKEFVGPGGKKFSFSINLNVSEKINPREQMERLEEIAQTGEVLPFFMGEKPFGNFVITSLSGTYPVIDNKGGIWRGTAQISIEEYGDNVTTDNNGP